MHVIQDNFYPNSNLFFFFKEGGQVEAPDDPGGNGFSGPIVVMFQMGT